VTENGEKCKVKETVPVRKHFGGMGTIDKYLFQQLKDIAEPLKNTVLALTIVYSLYTMIQTKQA
jgi:hypothetical protein